MIGFTTCAWVGIGFVILFHAIMLKGLFTLETLTNDDWKVDEDDIKAVQDKR